MKFPKGFFKYDIERLIDLHREGKINEFKNLKSSPVYTTIFHYFGKNRRFDMIDYFLKSGNINIDFGEPTLLMMGCKKGNFKLVEESVKRGADVNQISDGNTPLLTSLDTRNAKIVNYLLKNGADPNEGYGGNIPLLVSYEDANERLMKLLLWYKADPNVYLIEGTPLNNTLLYSACEDMKEGVVRLLLKYGANPNIHNSNNIPLLVACENGDNKIVEMLLKGGAKVNTYYPQDHIPVVYNDSVRRELPLLELFLKYGYDINSTYAGNTILHHECDSEYPKVRIINFLLERGCDINQRNMNGDSPLSLVTKGGDVKALKFLLDIGAEVELNEEGKVKYMDEEFYKYSENVSEIELIFEEYFLKMEMRRNKKGIPRE
jgi:ankyrin repeat protein